MFDDLLEANRRYRAEFHDSGVPASRPRGSACITCIDSRIDPLAMLGLQAGDAKIIRNAGARCTDDALRSLILAANLLGVHRVCVVQHTDCAMAGNSEARDAAHAARPAAWTPATGSSSPPPTSWPTLRADLERITALRAPARDLEVAASSSTSTAASSSPSTRPAR